MNFTEVALSKIKALDLFKGDVLWTINHGFAYNTYKGGKKYYHPATNIYVIVCDDTIVTVYHHDEHNERFDTIVSNKGTFKIRTSICEGARSKDITITNILHVLNTARLDEDRFWPEYRWSMFHPTMGIVLQICKETNEIVGIRLPKKGN